MSHKLRMGELSSVDTLHAYQWKAIQLNKKQNCIVHFIEDAEEEAKKCDQFPLKGNLERMFNSTLFFDVSV